MANTFIKSNACSINCITYLHLVYCYLTILEQVKLSQKHRTYLLQCVMWEIKTETSSVVMFFLTTF